MFFVYHTSLQKVQEYKDLQSLVEMFEKADTEGDLFWTLGHKSWIPLTEVLTGNIVAKKKYQFPSLPQVTQATTPTSRPPEPTKPLKPQQEEPTDFKIISYEPPTPSSGSSAKTKSPSKDSEHRKHPRFDVRLKVIISNKEKTFLSYTSNASMGGLLLEDNIPQEFFSSDEAEIFVSSPKKNEFLAFRCRPVGDDETPKRFSFGAMPEESLLKFQNWIEKVK